LKGHLERISPDLIKCVVFDFGFTLSSDLYFKIAPPGHPEWRAVIQKYVFEQPALVNAWMKGDLSSADIAGIISGYIPLDVPDIVAWMDRGCEHLDFNSVVWEFACAQREAGRQTALVTDNMDVFTRVVVPSHHLDEIFDVILNSSDFRETRKEFLWPIAFERLGNGIGYANSLLIEDGVTEPARFRTLGGRAYPYSNDTDFRKWLEGTGWNHG
jgi:hypothetical protein